MASIWRLNEDRVEFERVTSAVLDADPDLVRGKPRPSGRGRIVRTA
ncbi:hypothetical protein GNQ09_29025 [Pseudomonas aeruginosa]|nr:hypothetical protein [Pseudomonas aeruginosa]MUJ15521.1 hypothetical protein [Pseudomonas aeruginosa]